MRRLLARGADPNSADKLGATALTFAARGGHVDAARALLAAGADPFVHADFESAPIDIAISRDERALVEAMVTSRLAAIDSERATYLLVLSRVQGRREIAEFLLRELRDRLPATADPQIGKAYDEKLAKAHAAWQRGDASTTIGLAEEAIALDPAGAPAYLAAAYGYMARKNYGRAKERARQASERSPEDAYPWRLLGSVYLETGDFEESDRALTRALELHVLEPESAYADRAVARMELGRPTQALDDARAACKGKSELGCGLVQDLQRQTESAR